jgi:hypothetical protein
MATRSARPGVTLGDVRAVALDLPRAYEALVRDYVKFRVRSIVFCSVSPDETLMGFGFPKEERESIVATRPETFLMPVTSDLRYHWVRARMAALDPAEMRELVVDAWRMCVPKFLAAEYDTAARAPLHPASGCQDRPGTAPTQHRGG